MHITILMLANGIKKAHVHTSVGDNFFFCSRNLTSSSPNTEAISAITDKVSADTVSDTNDTLLTRAQLRRQARIQMRQHLDSAISLRQRTTTDVRYVVRPEPHWTFRIKTEGSGSFMHIRSINEDAGHNDYVITSTYNQNIGLSANYRGLSVSLSVNPLKILGKYSDTEFDFNHYNNQYGIDFNYSRKRRLRGRSRLFDYSHQQTLHHSRYRQTALDAYWVFNGKRFSYPAVFNNTWIQRRSAGSALLTATYYDALLTTNGEIDILEKDGLTMHNTKLRFFTLGCGYAYNFVPSQHWLIHLSLQPSFMLWKYARINFMPDMAGREHHYTMPYSFWNGFVIGRIGFNYAWRRYFLGLNGVMRSYRLGHSNGIRFVSTSWKCRLYFGMRI